MAERAGKPAEMMLGSLVVFQGEQNRPPLFRKRSPPFVDLGDGLRELLLARGMRSGVHLALHLGARKTQRLDLSCAFGIDTLGPLPGAPSFLFALFHSLGEAGLRVDEAFSSVTHILRLSTHIRPMHNG